MEELRGRRLNDRKIGGGLGCAYIIDDGEGRRFCGEGTAPGFILLPAASCALPSRLAAQRKRPGACAKSKRSRARSADAAGLRGGGPSRRFLRRFEQAARAFS